LKTIIAISVLLLASQAWASETAEHISGRGLTHFKPRVEHSPALAEIVDLCPDCRQPEPQHVKVELSNIETVELKKFVPPVFSDSAPKPTASEKIKEAAKPVLVEIIDAEKVVVKKFNPEQLVKVNDAAKVKAKEFSAEKVLAATSTAKLLAPQDPTAEQLQLMRDFHLSSPPTILAADNSVRAAGRTSGGTVVTSYQYTQPYCPECERKRKGY
jgi:hypothetical protein